MALPDFPNNPTLNEQFAVGTNIYQWDGEKWKALSNADNSLRSQLADVDSTVLVGGVEARLVTDEGSTLSNITQTTLSDGKLYKVRDFYPDTGVGGGVFVYRESGDLTLSNGGTHIAVDSLNAWRAAAISLGGITKDNLRANLGSLYASQTGTGGLFVRVHSIPFAEEEIAPEWFGATSDNDQPVFKKITDSGFRRIALSARDYTIQKPIQLPSGTTIIGQGRKQSAIVKTTNTAGTGSNTARGGTITDSYAQNAVIIYEHGDDNYNANSELKDLSLEADGYIVNYGIYAPRTTGLTLTNIDVFQCRYGFYTHDSWQAVFTGVVVNANSVAPSGVPNIAGSAFGYDNAEGFVWADDGSGGATGTSLVATRCWARDCHRGWNIFGLQYSTLNSCAADNITSYSYFFNSATITLNGCGAENGQIGTAALIASAADLTINGMNIQKQYGGTASSSLIKMDGGRITFNSCEFDDFVDPSSALNVVIEGGAKVVNNNSRFPTNGNNFISYAGGARLIDNSGDLPVIRDATSSREVYGSIRDDKVVEKKNISIPSGGAGLFTLTDVGSGSNIRSAVARVEVSWSDNTFPSGVGVANLEVGVYYDGTVYRENLNTSVNFTAGNGLTGVPTFTITRSGSVWTVNMNPLDGAATVLFLKVQPDVQNDIDVSA